MTDASTLSGVLPSACSYSLVTKHAATSGWFRSTVLSDASSLKGAPSRSPVASIGALLAVVRYAPTLSKFSSPRPTGSIIWWQEAQAGFFRCASRTALTDDPGGSMSRALVSTLGGGGGTVLHKSCWETNRPRRVGEVRCGRPFSARIAPLPRSPTRGDPAG